MSTERIPTDIYRPAPPIGRCASCACWDENTCECEAAERSDRHE